METPKDPDLENFRIDTGPESHVMWVCFLDENGECWTVPNPEVRMQSNWSLHRRFRKPPSNVQALPSMERA